MKPKILGISHLGMAARDSEKAKWFFSDVLGLELEATEIVADQKTKTTVFPLPNCSPRLEFLEPSEPGEGPIAKYLANNKGGIHHLALQVDDIHSAIEHLASAGVDLIDSEPRKGAGGCSIAFVHPRSTGGFLVELVQE